MRDRRTLEVFQLSMDLVKMVYRATATYPIHEKFGLVSQMRRAAVSIPSNLAEGCARVSDSEFARFVNIAYGSCQELIVQIEIAESLEYQTVVPELTRQADRVGKSLHGLWLSVSGRTPDPGPRTPSP